MMRTPLTAAALLLALGAGVSADEYGPAMQAYLDSAVRAWAADPVLIQAIADRNGATSALSQADIDTMDQTWRAEVGGSATPTIDPVLNSAAAEFLRQRVAESGGAITEAFVMDSRGLLVAASDVTSDYWQGDEAKWQETYPKGAAAVHLSDVEFDESSQTYQGQVSIAVVDPSGAVIGALTVGLNADML
jgi:hypothetical protein